MATKEEVLLKAVEEEASDEELLVLEQTPDSEFDLEVDPNANIIDDEASNIPIVGGINDSDTEDNFLEQPVDNVEEPVITKEEFNLFEGDDVEEQLSKLINSKLSHQGVSAKASTPEKDVIEITNSAGATIEIPLYTDYNVKHHGAGKGESPMFSMGGMTSDQPYEDFINFINTPVDQKQADIYQKTKIKADEDGSYNITIQHADNFIKNWITLDPLKATSDQMLELTTLIENETNKALTSVSIDGRNMSYAGLDLYNNSFDLQNITEENREQILDAVYEKVQATLRFGKNNKFLDKTGITRDEFNKVIGGDDSGFFTNTVNSLASKQRKENNIKALEESYNEVSKPFVEEQTTNIKNSLTEQEKIHFDYQKEKLIEIEKLKRAIDSEDKDGADAIRVVIDGIDRNILANATTTHIKHTYSVSGMLVVEEIHNVNERLATSFIDNDVSEYRAQNAADAGTAALSDIDLFMQLIFDANPTATPREALQKYYDTKTIRHQQLKVEGQDTMIKLNVKNLESAIGYEAPTHGEPDYTNAFTGIGKLKRVLGDLKSHEGYEKGEIEISLSDLLDSGADARDFKGWFDWLANPYSQSVMSEKDLELLEQFELVLDQNMGERRGIFDLLYLNADPEGFEKQSWYGSMFREGAQAALTSWLDRSATEAQLILGGGDYTERALKDHIQTSLYNYNAEFAGETDPFTGEAFQPINLSDEQMEALARSFGEEVGEGVGAFIPMMVEFGIINSVTGGILSYGQIGRVYQMFRTGNKAQKLAYHGFNIAVEEAKMQNIWGMHAGGGTAFYTVGTATQGISPFKKEFAFLNALYQKTVHAGVVGSTASEFAGISEDAWSAFMGNKDFASNFNEMYGDLPEFGKRFLINAMVFGMTGAHHVKKHDFLPTQQKIDLRAQLNNANATFYDQVVQKHFSYPKQGEKGWNEFMPVFGQKPHTLEQVLELMPEKMRKTFHSNTEFSNLLGQQIRIEERHQRLDPLGGKTKQEFEKLPKSEQDVVLKDFEKNFRKEELDPLNERMKKLLGPDFVPIKLELSSDRGRYDTNKKGQDKGNTAQYSKETKTVLLDPKNFGVNNSKYKHEITHAILDAHFAKNPQGKIGFLRKMKSILSTLDLKTPEGTPLAEAIENAYKKDSDGVKLEEYMTSVVEILANPAIYNQKASSSVFSSIKQQFVGVLENYGYSPNIRTRQDLIDAIGRIARGYTTPANIVKLAETPMLNVKAHANNVKIEKESVFGSRELNQKKETLQIQKKKLIASSVNANTRLKELKMIKPDLLSKKEKAEIKELDALIKQNQVDLVPINKEIKVAEQNIQNNEVNKENITIYKDLTAKKEAQLQEGGRLYEKVKELEKLKKEFPEGSSEITRLEKEIRENKLSQSEEIKLQRAGNKLEEVNAKLISEFVGKSYEAGGKISIEDYMGGLREEVAKIYKSYDPAKNDSFGIYLRQTLFGKDYNYTGTAKPLRYGNVIKNVNDMTLSAMEKGATGFTGTEVLENMQDVSGGTGREAYIQGTNYSIGKGKLVVDLLKGQIPDAALKEVKRNITKDGVVIDGKLIKFNDLTYNELTNLVTKSTGKDVFGKNYKQKAEYIFKNWDKITQILPKNLNTITGEAGIVETVLLDAHYKSAEQSKRIDITQGNVEGVGNVLRELRPQTQEQFLAEYKLKIDENGNLDYSGLDKKGKSKEEILEIRNILETKIPALEGQIMRALTNQVVRQEIADRVQNGDINLGKKVGVQNIMNQIRSGKNDVLASKLDLNYDQLAKLEMDLLNHKGQISMVTVYRMMEENNLSINDRKRLGGIIGDIVTKYDAKNLTKEQAKEGLKIEKEKELTEAEIKEIEYVDQNNYNKLTDFLNKEYPHLSLVKDKYNKLGENPITIEEMRVIDAKLIALFPEGLPKEFNKSLLEQFGIGQRRLIDGKRINMSRDINGKTSVDLTIEALIGESRGNNGKKYQGEYDAFKITDPGTFKNALRKFREEYKGEDLNGDLYDKARELLTKKGINPKTKKPYTFEQTFAANEKLRTDYITGMYEILRKTPKSEQGKVVQGFLRHFQMQTNHGTGISKGTFTFTAVSNMLGEIVPGSKSGYHAEHKLQLQNYHANVVGIMLRNINNPKKFLKELELLNKDAQQTVTKYTDKMDYDAKESGGQSGNIDRETGQPSYSVGTIKADITYMINRPGIASETVNLLGPRGKTLADKIIDNATRKDITEALAGIKKENWTSDVYSLEYRNNSRELRSPTEVNNAVEVQNLSVNKEIMASKLDLNLNVNKMWGDNFSAKLGERGEYKIYSDALTKQLSSRRKWYEGLSKELFVGSRADDFRGLTNYRLVNKKGKEGEAQQKFYDDHLHIPYAMGINAINVAKTKVQTEYKNLNKQFPNIKKILNKDIPGEIFSNSNAVRVYLWTKAGYNMTEFGLSKKDLKKLNEAVTSNPELQAYADNLGILSGVKKGYVQPDAFWLTQGIKQDLAGLTLGKNRDNYLSEFNANVDIMFSRENLNKLEVIHGPKYRESLENSIYRMKTGSNRVFSKTDKIMNEFNDWVNGAVGVTMFLNTKSAALQLQSTLNYFDFNINSPLKVAKTVANPKQYLEDCSFIFNHPTIKQRRGGLQTDVNFSELAGLSKKGGVKGLTAGLLKTGFAPTIIADNLAITLGGASFYRNYYNHLIKQSKNAKDPLARSWYELRKKSVKELEKKAKEEAWNKFMEKTQTTQQSSDPSKISSLQASGLGRLVFAFQNTPMQYTREMKKSIIDLNAGRGDAKHNISKILYYGAVQNLIFGALQNAMFTSVFDDDEQQFDTKSARVLNGMFDSVLRGSGLPGAVLATTKNTLMKFAEEENKGFNADHAQTLIQAANFAPPIGIKARKLYTAMRTYQFNKDVIPHVGYSINNPAYSVIGNVTAATTNFPLDAVIRKSYNLQQVISGDIEWWQRTSLLAGYRPYQIGVEDPEIIKVEEQVKEEKLIKSKEKAEVKKEEKKIEEKKIKIEKGEEKQEQEKKDDKQVTCLVCKLPVLEGQKYCTVHQEVKQRKDGKEVQCSFIKNKDKKSEKQCGVMTTSESGLCYYHD